MSIMIGNILRVMLKPQVYWYHPISGPREVKKIEYFCTSINLDRWLLLFQGLAYKPNAAEHWGQSILTWVRNLKKNGENR